MYYNFKHRYIKYLWYCRCMKKINAKNILEKLEPDGKKAPVSLYLDKKLYKDFKKACGKVPASKVMEEFMREFLESVGK